MLLLIFIYIYIYMFYIWYRRSAAVSESSRHTRKRGMFNPIFASQSKRNVPSFAPHPFLPSVTLITSSQQPAAETKRRAVRCIGKGTCAGRTGTGRCGDLSVGSLSWATVRTTRSRDCGLPLISLPQQHRAPRSCQTQMNHYLQIFLVP